MHFTKTFDSSKFQCLRENTEKYISFTVSMDKIIKVLIKKNKKKSERNSKKQNKIQ